MPKRKKKHSKMPATLIVIIVLIIVVSVAYLNRDKIYDLVKKSTSTNNTNDKDDKNDEIKYGQNSLVSHYINVGQGDSILIELPENNAQMLIDCGCKGVTKPYSEIKSYIDSIVTDNIIEYLVLTHTDEDHVSYLDDIISDYQVNNIYMPYILSDPTNVSLKEKVNALDSEKLALFKDEDTISTQAYANFFINALSEPNCTIHLNVDDDDHTTNNKIVSEEYNYEITFICPTLEFYTNTHLNDGHAKNAVSPVIIIEYNGRKLVYTGDSNAYWNSKGELKTTEGNEWFMVQRIKQLYGDDSDFDVLKVAHHGAGEASSNKFLDAVKCEYGIISCGSGNTYNHPRNECLERLKAHNYTIYRTDLNGNIKCIVNATGVISFEMEIDATQEAEYIPAD